MTAPRPWRVHAAVVFTMAATLMGAGSRASADGITALAGECLVTFHGTFDAVRRVITLSTPDPGTCVTTFGGGIFVLHEGSVGPSPGGVIPGFTCAGGVGRGLADFTISTATISVRNRIAGLDVTAGGSEAAVTIFRDAGIWEFVSHGPFEQDPPLAEMCAIGASEMTWTGRFPFAYFSGQPGFQQRGVHADCEVGIQAIRHPASGKVTLSTPEPGSCGTNWGPGVLTLEGDVGADGTLPGFTCAGGAGTGNLSLSLSTPFISLVSDNVSLHAAQAGKAMKLSLTEHNATDHINGGGAFVQLSTNGVACDSHPDRALWTGRIALEALQDTRRA